MHPLTCADESMIEGISDSEELANWLNSWLADKSVSKCVIEKSDVDGACYFKLQMKIRKHR